MKNRLKWILLSLFIPFLILGQEGNSSRNKTAKIIESDKKTPKKRNKVVLFLPFNLERLNNDTINTTVDRLKKDKFLNMTLDFYSGVLIAIDSARKVGVDMDVSIYDSEETKNSSKMSFLIKKNNLGNESAVIGPFYQDNVENTANLLCQNQVPVISPLSSESAEGYGNIFQTKTPTGLMRRVVYDYLINQNGVVIAVVDNKKAALKKEILENHKSVQVIDLKVKGVSLRSSLKNNLIKDKKNYIVLETTNTSLIKETISTLLSVKSAFDVQLVVSEPNETLETDEINMIDLVDLRLMYPSHTRENNSPEALIFKKNYKEKNRVAPNSFAIRGFDITFDTLIRLSQSRSYPESVFFKPTEQIESKFNYIKTADGGGVNKGLYMLYYDSDFTIKEAK